MKKFLEIIKNKWLIKGTTTILLVLIVIACYIGLNMLVEKINIDDIDLTEKKLYSISEETKTKLKDLNEDVTIEIINTKNYSYLVDYIKKYSLVNEKIKIDEVEDLASRVDLQTKYNINDIVEVKVVKFMQFGAFAELEPGIEGLIHISQISEERIAKPEDKLHIGQILNAKIIDIDTENKKIGLSIKELEGTSYDPEYAEEIAKSNK